jgi:Putative peptidoglycan binding domain
MSTDYTTTDARQTTRFLTAAIAFCVVGIVAIAAVAGFALGGHFTTTHKAAVPANTSGIIIPAVPVTPTPSHTVTPVTPKPAPSAAVVTLQKQLGLLNYYEGPVDGLMGPQTIAAITYLQRDAGLPQTGTMNAATQAALANYLAHGNNQMAS